MNEEEKEALEYIKGQLSNSYIDISGSYPEETEFNIIKEAIELYEQKQKIEKQQAEIEKKDKIIDLMIAFICKNYGGDEDITNFVVSRANKKEWTNLSDVLKEYFERKIEQ